MIAPPGPICIQVILTRDQALMHFGGSEVSKRGSALEYKTNEVEANTYKYCIENTCRW